MRKMYFAIFAFLTTAIAFSQGTITGTIVDGDMGDPLPGANVMVQGTSNGVATDFDGKFTIEVASGEGTLVVSYIGYVSKKVSFTKTGNIGNISLESNSEELGEIVVVGGGLIDLADDRQTPIAVSTIPASVIQEKIGTQDITMTMVNTPSVYVTGQSGGFGDSSISVRGFEQDNTAFLLNGQPINGMEDGLMYWSNWSGLTDIAKAVQIQRGLGSSKLAISSVGGTVNFVTKTTEMREGGFAYAGIANDNYLKTTVGYNSGISKKGFGVSVMFTHWQGDGYNDGTFGEGQNYFISFGYKVNEKHNLNFLITGAPQWHDQNYTKAISEYLEYGKRYNGNYGYLNGSYLSQRRNFYHKPVANLNWDWTISDKSSLSTVLYASWGRGGGTGSYGNGPSYIDGGVNDDDGLINWDNVVDYNSTVDDGIGNGATYTGSALRASMNNHAWYGIVSNYETELSENLTFNVGADLRTYKGTHFRQLVNLLGLSGFDEGGISAQYSDTYIVSSTFKASPWSSLGNFADEDERIAYDYDERINYGGLFSQIEYGTDNFSAFFQGAISNQSHVRWDRFNYIESEEESEKINNFGFNIKGGSSYVINDSNKVYVNAGYYSRQPYHDNIYLNYTNEVNPLTENEKILGFEAGYSFATPGFKANLNLYRTSWKDRVTSSSETDDDTGELIYETDEGVEQLHQGIELDFTGMPTNNLKINGFLSIGDWKYVGDAQTTTRDEDRNVLSVETSDVDGGKVGNAAQFTAGLGLDYQIINNLSIDSDYRFYDNLYADVGAIKENLELPSFGLLDAGVTYTMLLGEEKNKSLNIRMNVNNVLNTEYISESGTAEFVEDGTETFQGLNTNNEVYFGYGTTWNLSLRYKF
ncbi:TonB-dependent receptor [Cellulophaga baltica]|uniref:TonB-dependent receptor n=1 Tax=Cellulophaga TaxID=104264 RepID=UPI001C06CF17|nr:MULTISPECIES: carboxypeptidase-like regulatory domain-containing protein [Cellulophaga]MBU2995687.1 TonB-dependent receptor [Cellulophaga baltica]MDO6767081.1 carboxypeptidase-like regulatory domain-containing protein [Cellulophaga sp. 1_MG-2023]